MSMIGVLGGLGPAATVDLLDKIVRLTPARRDQEHIPVITACLPHVPDRSDCILGVGEDPLPGLLRGIDLLNRVGVGVVVIPCNSAHHWYDQLSERSAAPILHISQVCVDRIDVPRGSRVLVLATGGAVLSGFYQRAITGAGLVPLVPDPKGLQPWVDDCIRQVKAGDSELGGKTLGRILQRVQPLAADHVVLGCTELSIAARFCETGSLPTTDSSLSLAQAVVAYAVDRRWHLIGT